MLRKVPLSATVARDVARQMAAKASLWLTARLLIPGYGLRHTRVWGSRFAGSIGPRKIKRSRSARSNRRGATPLRANPDAMPKSLGKRPRSREAENREVEVPAREGRPRYLLRCGEGDLRAREAAKHLQGVRGLGPLRAGGSETPARSGGSGLCEHEGRRSRCKECGARAASMGGRQKGTARSAGARASASTGRQRQVQGLSRGSRGVRRAIPPSDVSPTRRSLPKIEARVQRDVRSGRRPRRGGGARDQARVQRRDRPWVDPDAEGGWRQRQAEPSDATDPGSLEP